VVRGREVMVRDCGGSCWRGERKMERPAFRGASSGGILRYLDQDFSRCYRLGCFGQCEKL